MLEVDPSKISNKCVVALNTLIFTYSHLQLSQFVDLNELVPEPHP